MSLELTPNEKAELNRLKDVLLTRVQPLLICLSNAWGGLEQVAAADAADLAEQGFQVRLLCLKDSPIDQHFEKPENHQSGVLRQGITFRPRNLFDLRMSKLINEYIADGVNLIHSHQTSLLGSVVPWVWRKHKVACIASRHITSDHRKTSFFHRAIYDRLDALVVMSQALRDNVLQTHAVRENKVKIIRLGLDFSKFQHFRDMGDPFRISDSATVEAARGRRERKRASWGITDGDTVAIGVVGRIDPAKGQDTFIKAAASLVHAEMDRELRFIIVGETTRGGDVNYVDELRETVAQLQVDDKVLFTGFDADIPGVMEALDIFVMPSRHEAFGLVAIEAMAMGCPVIVSSGGSADEIVGDDEYGLRTRANDAFDLRRQLKRLISDIALRHELSRKAEIFVRAHYDRNERVVQTLQLYERVLRRRKVFLQRHGE